ncbi:MAG: cation:proton antiporter [Alphaproteobacteria bacterium]|nr:cation:proton antiporter [Alphaproteobacteria bacterium]
MPDTHYIRDVLILLASALVCVPLFERLRMGPVLGYLAAGFVVGPTGFQLISGIEGTRALAELGVVFLLFTIGLELTFERLKSIGLRVYGLGLAQVTVTATLIGLVVVASGYDTATGITVGGALALSSTAIVLQVLADRNQHKTRFGRVALAVLLLQDLAVSPLLVLLAVLGRDHGAITASLWSELGIAAVKAAVAIAVILALGRVMLRPLLRVVAVTRSPELFAAMTLLVALGTSWLTEQAGLSMAFGAFLAGLLLAETEYRHQVAADIEPFRGTLLGLFFMTVGMMVDLRIVVSDGGLVVALLAALLVGKTLVLAGLGVLFGFQGWRALRLGSLLSQGGEFAFVLLGMAMASHVIPGPLGQVLFVVVAASMAVTPPMVAFGGRLLGFLESREALEAARLGHDAGEMSGHVIIIGFGEVGRIIARMLKAYGLSYLVIDLSPRRIIEGRGRGEPVFYGDAGLATVLHAAAVERARSVVVATGKPSMTLRIAQTLRGNFPHVPVFARGGDEQSVIDLYKMGVIDPVPETTEVGLRLSGAILDQGGDPPGLPANNKGPAG